MTQPQTKKNLTWRQQVGRHPPAGAVLAGLPLAPPRAPAALPALESPMTTEPVPETTTDTTPATEPASAQRPWWALDDDGTECPNCAHQGARCGDHH